jgi:hypothetical protein
VNDATVGGVRGATGFPAPGTLSASPHPATKPANRNASIQIFRAFALRIKYSDFIDEMAR